MKKHLRAQAIAEQLQPPASIWRWIPAAPSRPRDEVFPTGSILAASSTTRLACRPRASPAGGGDGALYRRRLRARGGRSIMDQGQPPPSGGPPLVKAATGERRSRRSLGGAEVHLRPLWGGGSHGLGTMPMPWPSPAPW